MPVYKIDNLSPGIDPTSFVADSAQIIGDVTLKKNSSVWFGSVLRGDIESIEVGENTNIQDLSICHSDPGTPCIIGDFVTVGHRCVIHGCVIEDRCLIGMGAIVLNGAKIGRGSIIAAGSVVLENQVIPPYSLVTGVPGKIKKTFENQEEMEAVIQMPADVYTQRSVQYKNNFSKIQE
jgi:carbonic anhydrase/acetyltransferase-like protein (isoleucine patch superfamily)